MSSMKSCSEALCALIASSFIYDMQYPKNFEAVLIFLQHLVLNVKDKVPLPLVGARVYSALESMTVVQ